MKRLLRFILLGLILVLVMMLSAVTAMRFAIHGRELLVPKFIGLKQAEAQRIAENNGLVLDQDERFYSAAIAEGAVLSQAPGPGVRVRRGTRVRVALSLGPAKTEVPDLSGQSLRAAQINVQRRGLDIGDVAALPTSAAGDSQVIAQAPPAGAAASSQKVNLLISAPDAAPLFFMPDLVGKQLADVQKQIEDAGFTVKVNAAKQSAESAPLSTAMGSGSPTRKQVILKQDPPFGHRVAAKATITLDVSAQ